MDKFDVKKWSSLRKETFRFFEENLRTQEDGSTLLDLGAGNSPFQKLFSRFKVTTLDKDPHEGVDVVADLTKKLPFNDGHADIIVLSHVLEHIPEPQALLSECRRVLKPGGMLIGATPFLVCVHQEPYDFFRYTKYGLEYLLEKAGFSNFKVETLGSIHDTVEGTIHKFAVMVEMHRYLEPFILLLLKFFKLGKKKDRRFAEGYGFVAS